MAVAAIRPFVPEDMEPITDILKKVGWADQYVTSQKKAIERLDKDEEGEVFVATLSGDPVGFIQVQHHQWNRLSFLHGLIVTPKHQKQGIGKQLVAHVEQSTKNKANRGVYLDTPVGNVNARDFYRAIGFTEAYIMPEYYEPGMDGVTYLKLFEE